eukprot:4886797-Pyramimonas_sp.AAC.1
MDRSSEAHPQPATVANDGQLGARGRRNGCLRLRQLERHPLALLDPPRMRQRLPPGPWRSG